VGNYDETSTHKIRVVFSDTELSCCINIRSISIDSVIIIGRTSVPGAVNTENPELEISFTMPLYPYRKVSRLEKFNDEEVNYPEVFRIPFSSRIIKKHECKETLIEMMDDYYEKQEMTKLLSDKKLLSIPELYPLWLTFQTAFDDHCVKFNLPRVLISSSWFVSYKKLDSIKMHFHPGAVIVGAWYPYVDEENSAPVVFEHPSTQEIASSHSYRKGLVNIRTDNMDEYRIEEFEIQPKSGMMNIWPGYLTHWIRKNHTDERYIVTVNTILYSERDAIDKDYRIEPLETW
jgi:hypothetical protein